MACELTISQNHSAQLFLRQRSYPLLNLDDSSLALCLEPEGFPNDSGERPPRFPGSGFFLTAPPAIRSHRRLNSEGNAPSADLKFIQHAP